MNPGLLAILVLLAIAARSSLHGQAFGDSGFENELVSSGGFVRPTSGPWVFGNDAGVVEPFSPNSSTGPLNTWSATLSPMEGGQYASTYAGADTIRQALLFASAGDYRLSVYAAAPTGTLTIPTVGTFTLVDSEFTLTLNNVAIGSLHTVPLGSGWAQYEAVFTLALPGTYALGIRNTKAAAYFINYDAFGVEAVPEPASSQLLLTFGLSLVGGLPARRFLKARQYRWGAN